MLDLDHVGAEVAEEHTGERRREKRGRLDDPDSPERVSSRQVDGQPEADPGRAGEAAAEEQELE